MEGMEKIVDCPECDLKVTILKCGIKECPRWTVGNRLCCYHRFPILLVQELKQKRDKEIRCRRGHLVTPP